MLTFETRELLNKSNDWVAAKNKVGDLLHKGFNVAKANYSFARDGGAQGTITLKDQDGVSAVVIPSGAVVLSAFVRATAGLVSGGAATVDVQVEAANDLLAATAYTSLDTGDTVQCIPDFATLADSVVTTAERSVTMSINDAALTAGVFDVYVFYVF